MSFTRAAGRKHRQRPLFSWQRESFLIISYTLSGWTQDLELIGLCRVEYGLLSSLLGMSLFTKSAVFLTLLYRYRFVTEQQRQ